MELLNAVYPFLGFALATSITPGPNNIMLAASGANYGYLKAIPHLLGIVAGFFVLMIALAFGLGVLFQTNDWLHTFLKYAGAAYLLYLAWIIAASKPLQSDFGGNKITFWKAALFQFLNPKVWGMSLTAMTSFTLPGNLYNASAILIASVFVVVYVACGSLWIFSGVAIKNFLKKDGRFYTIFNVAMGMLLAATVFMIVY